MKIDITFIFLLCALYSFSNGILFDKYRRLQTLFSGVDRVSGTAPLANERKIFWQKLDHSDPTNTAKWKQRYFLNFDYYKSGGPAYLMINGEWTASSYSLSYGYWSDHGKQNNAILFSLEHRYYGYSLPTDDASTKNLRHLTTQQALADIAYFIENMNEFYKLPQNTKWIVFGGSYAGSLAAWVRMKYPHLVYAAVASSAPLLAQLDFYGYFEVVRDSLASYNESCPKEIAKAHKLMDRMVKTEKGREQITKQFRLCSSLSKKKEDISTFFSTAADKIAGVVQYNSKNSYSSYRISKVCDVMLNQMIKCPVERYAKAIESSDLSDCTDSEYINMVKYFQVDDWKSARRSLRAWIYQTCTEYGYYQTSSKKTDTFGRHFPVEFYKKLCFDVFGEEFNDVLLNTAVNRTNTFFGGLNINVGNIVYVHGSIDPWHALGIISRQKRKHHKVIYIKGASHCEDMGYGDQSDDDELKNSRMKIVELLDIWLKQKN